MRGAFVAMLLATTSVAGPVSLLRVGPQAGAAVKGQSASGWLGLWTQRLGPASVRFEPVRDPIADDGKPEAVMTGIDVHVDGEPPLILVKGLTARAVEPVLASTTSPCMPDKPVTLKDATVTCAKDGATGMKLVFTLGGKAQVLYRQKEGDTDGWQLRWAGDLNGDGQLDVLLSADTHYALETMRLFLSAKDGTLREAAVLRSTGC